MSDTELRELMAYWWDLGDAIESGEAPDEAGLEYEELGEEIDRMAEEIEHEQGIGRQGEWTSLGDALRKLWRKQ